VNTFFEIHVRTITGLEDVLAKELAALGAKDITIQNRVVICRGDLSILYKANIYCRTAIRVLRPISTFAAKDEKAFYEGIRAINWWDWVTPTGSIAIDANVSSSFSTHSLFIAQLTKDAIVDQFREKTADRPSVDLENPELRIAISLFQDRVQVYVDSSGESLHKRGYRRKAGEAPLSETLAAGIIQLSEWDGTVPLLDPMCGSGTLLIEAGLLLKNIAPGLLGRRYGFQQWKDYDSSLYKNIIEEAKKSVKNEATQKIIGLEINPEVAAIARENIERAGLFDLIEIKEGDFFETKNISDVPGILVMNPPYDERLPVDNVAKLYQKIGDQFKQTYGGWKAYVLAGNLEAMKYVGLRSSKRLVLFNGPIECRLLEYELRAGSGKKVVREIFIQPKWKEKAEVLANRLRKNLKHFSKWAKREGISCYRLYDWDIPELAFLIDIYGDRLHFAEIERNHDRSPIEHEHYMQHILQSAADAVGIPIEKVYYKKRKPQKEGKQYLTHADTNDFFEVSEGGHKFLVNLADYIDVGLFLDHRKTRARVQKEVAGKDFLNLFAYTGSFTIYAAAGGAKSTTTVDTSNTYLDWAERNLLLNGFSGKEHRLERSDSFEFLEYTQQSFDVCVVDPPTRSVNKSSGRFFDVQSGHVALLRRVLKRMRKGGIIYFSTNFRNFEFDEEELKSSYKNLSIKEITAQTIPLDFERKPSHRCWLIAMDSY
jgi:23S rRNA (guanine2445-N2)-methyltransferase / 23S rRNA (guanine2069-N7)-methyltransferase